jgi:hypothetical protein
MSNRYDFSELEEMIRLGLREQAIHPQGLNSSQTHGTLYPVGDPRNDGTHPRQKPKLTSSKLMRTGIGSRRNWG